MAKISPSVEETIIKDLVDNDPEFLNLSPEQQDLVIDRIVQEEYGVIPNSNQLLDRAVKPFMAASDIPQIAFQTGQGIIGNAPQNIVENPMTAAMSGLPGVQAKSGAQGITALKKLIFGGNAVEPETTEFSEKYLEPKTVGGKIAGVVGNIAGGSIIPGIGIAKGASSALRTTPVKQGIEDLIFKGSNQVDQGVDDIFKVFNQRFGEGIDQLSSTMTTDNFADLVTRTAQEIGEFHPSRNILLSQLENIIKNSSREMSPRDVQNAFKTISRSLGDNRSKAILNKNYLELIDQTVPGLREIKAAHAPVYEAAKGAKNLGKGTLRKIANKKIGPEELGVAKESQSRLGIDIIGPLEKQGNKLEKIIRNKKIAAAFGIPTALYGATQMVANMFKEK